jgi:exopolysaccharide biosynthesis protein
MRRYVVRFGGSITLPHITHEFSQSSDEMAKEAAQKLLKILFNETKIYEIDLFNEDDEYHVASYRAEQEVVIKEISRR